MKLHKIKNKLTIEIMLHNCINVKLNFSQLTTVECRLQYYYNCIIIMTIQKSHVSL